MIESSILKKAFWSITCATLLGGACDRAGVTVVHPNPVTVSQPAPVNQVQCAVFWIHPTDPAKSLLIITNEKRGLELHDPNGRLLKHLNEGICPNYVDVIYDFPLLGKPTDLALATCSSEMEGVRIWRIDPSKRRLYDIDKTPVQQVLDGAVPTGLATYHSKKSGKFYFFVTQREGEVEQYELLAENDGSISSKRVRTFALKNAIKSCTTDEELGLFYVAEDHFGIWRYPAEPDDVTEPKLIIRCGENDLVPNVKGPTLFGAKDGKGYLIVVSEGSKLGNSCINVYERQEPYRFILSIDPKPGEFGAIDHSSGAAITNQSIGPLFPFGVLAVNDQINPNASEDFKLYSWKDIAKSGHLIIDTTWSRRGLSAKK